MSGLKRRHSPVPYARRKTAKLDASNSVQDEEEDLEFILEQIRQQDESEALAQKLQQEFDAPQVTQVIDLTKDHDTSPPSSDKMQTSKHEDDEAMALRLAREWEELDAMEVPSKVRIDEAPYRRPLTRSELRSP